MFKNSEMREILQEIEEFIEQEKKEGGIFENVEEYAKKRLLFDDQTAKKYAENFNNQITDKISNHYNFIRSSCLERLEKYRLTGKSTGLIVSVDFKNDEFEKLGIKLNTKLIQEYIEGSEKSFSEAVLIDLLKKLGHDIRLQILKTKYKNMSIDMIAVCYVETKKHAYTVVVDKIAVLVLLDNTKAPIYNDYLFWDHVFTFKT